MKDIIAKLRANPNVDELKDLFMQACEISGEGPEDIGLVLFEDDEVKEWVENEHPELVDKLNKGLSKYTYANGNDYLYALCDAGNNDNEVIGYVAMYCVDNPEKLSEIINELEDAYAE